jgi:MFS family permease
VSILQPENYHVCCLTSFAAICRFAEPIALTSVFPYLPEMIESFNVPTDQIAQWAGTTSAIFSLSQALTGIWWGWASDRFGRKPTILCGLVCTMASSIVFGFSKTLLWALLARAFGGLANGNVGTIRTTVAELVPQKELQPRAFSIMPMVWQIGSILGPAFGGALVHPNEHFSGLFDHSSFFRRNPFCLPGLVSGLFFLVGIASGVLFLQETLETRKHRKDYGLMVGSVLTESCSKRRKPLRRSKPWQDSDAESRPFLEENSDEEPSTPLSRTRPTKQKMTSKEPGYREVFSRQSSINLCAYTLLAMHSVAYDQVVPIFMHHPPQSIDDLDVHLPFKFAGGFGINSGRIGALSTIYGVFGMLIQFTVFPPLARKLGVLRCFRITVLSFPIIYFLTPFTSLLPTLFMKQAIMLALMLCKGWLCVFAFPCSTILLTNSAVSLKILGTLNGVSTSISALGRAAGPALCGVAFTMGVARGYIIAPWWLLTIIAILAAIPVFWLIEMEGFGDKEAEDEDDNGGEDEARGDTTNTLPELGATLRRTAASAMIDEDVLIDDTEESLDDAAASRKTFSHTTSRQASKNSLRSLPPIGMGEGITPRGARRLSSDLGATRSGLGTGGTTFQ